MVNVYLDTNILFDLADKKISMRDLVPEKSSVYISPLSVHIFCYVNKIALPDSELGLFLEQFILTSFDPSFVHKALTGPTKDFEDNVQLHCATEASCDYFLTKDKELLKMGYFGKMCIAETALPKSFH